MRETQRTFDAKITLVAGAADATTHMVAVTGTVNAEEHKYWLRPGSFCDVAVDVGATREVPLIPRFATRATDHGYVTYVVVNEVAQERVITLGMSTKDGWVEVKTGLKDGDMIVVHGAEALSTGARVKSSTVTSVDAGTRRCDTERGARRALRLGVRQAPRHEARRVGHAVSVTDVAIKNPVFAWMTMACTMLFGIVALSRIGISQFPDVDYPNVSVSISWPGASPPAVERELLEPLEQAISQVEGVTQIASTARSGSARITATFDMSRNVDLALQDIQAKVAAAQRQLPDDVQSPTVSKSNPDDQPILQVRPLGPVLEADARGRGAVPGAGAPPDRRGRRRDHALRLAGAKHPHLARCEPDDREGRRCGRHHQRDPDRARRGAGGSMDTGGRSLDVRLLGEALDLGTFSHIVVKKGKPATIDPKTNLTTAATNPTYLADVALVEDGFEDATSVSRLDGIPLQTLGILKQRGTNAVAVAEGVRERVDEINATLPQGMHVEVLFDSTIYISESVHELELELALAVALTAVVCWLFLGSLSSTLNVILAIPMSLLGTVAVVFFCGFTLNTFTLLGPVTRGRSRRRRRGHGHGEHLPPRGDGEGQEESRRRRHQRDLHRRARRDARGHRDLPPRHLHERRHREILLPVRRHALRRGHAVVLRGDHARPGALRADPERLARGPEPARRRGRQGVRQARGLLREDARSGPRTSGEDPRRCRCGPRVLRASRHAREDGVHPVAGPEPAQRPHPDGSRHDAGRGRAASRESGGAHLAAPRDLPRAHHPLGVVGSDLAHAHRSEGPKRLRAAADAEHAKRTSRASPASAARSRIPRSRASARRAARRSTSRSAAPTGPALIAASDMMISELQQSGFASDVTSDYQVGGSELQITPDRRRATDLGISISDLGSTISALVGGNTVGKYSTDGRRIDIRMRLLASQRTRPRGPRAHPRPRCGQRAHSAHDGGDAGGDAPSSRRSAGSIASARSVSRATSARDTRSKRR